MLNTHGYVFSLFLITINITGVYVGGFGTRVDLRAAEAIAKFLKVSLSVTHHSTSY